MAGELFSQDYHAECRQCHVPDGCDNKHEKCGIRRGVRYGIYPRSALRADCTGLKWGWDKPAGVSKEIPAFTHRDSMFAFCDAVQKFDDGLKGIWSASVYTPELHDGN